MGVDVGRGLSSSVSELPNHERPVSLGSSDNRLESLHRIPGLIRNETSIRGRNDERRVVKGEEGESNSRIACR